MTAMNDTQGAHLPHPHHLSWPREVAGKGGEKFILRPAQESDFGPLRAFFGDLPRGDRLFMQDDVSRNSQLFDRLLMESLHRERTLRLLALKDGLIVGHGLLEASSHLWSRHVGEVRVSVREEFRHRRLGTMILRELVDQAEIMGFDKLFVRLMDTQFAARKMCEDAGFSLEAELKNHVKDLDGNKHSMLILSSALDEAWHAMELLLDDVAPWTM